jgi:hypothetical protein
MPVGVTVQLFPAQPRAICAIEPPEVFLYDLIV